MQQRTMPNSVKSISPIQMCINSLTASKRVPGESLLFSSHLDQGAEAQTETFIIMLAELQQELKSQPWRVSVHGYSKGINWSPVNEIL